MGKRFTRDEVTNDTLSRLQWLYHQARARDLYFKEDLYRWRLGAKTVAEIKPAPDYQISAYSPSLLFGIPIETDYYNPETIQLWKNITNDV